MKQLLVFIGFSLLTCGVSSCDSIEPVDLVSISISPNQCAEPWDTLTIATDLKLTRDDLIKLYLNRNGVTGIYNFKSSLPSDSLMVVCLACTCPSGIIYSFDVSAKDYEKVKVLEPFATYIKKK